MFVVFTQYGSGGKPIIINAKLVVSVVESGAVSLKMVNGDYITVTGSIDEILNKLNATR